MFIVPVALNLSFTASSKCIYREMYIMLRDSKPEGTQHI